MQSIAKLLIILASLGTLVLPNLAVWNDTHIFSELWSPHARFHGAWQVIFSSGLGLATLFVAIKNDACGDSQVKFAANMLALYWACLFLAMLVPGVTLFDYGKSYGSLFGVPLNPIIAGAIVLMVVVARILSISPPRQGIDD